MKNAQNTPIDSSLNAGYAAIEKQPLVVESTIAQKENRINRMEFFQRILILFIITTLVYILFTALSPVSSTEDIKNFNVGNPLVNPNTVLISNLSWLVIYGVFYWILRSLCIKRYADFGDVGKTPQILIPVFFIINIYSYLLGIFSAYFGNPMMKYATEGSPLYYIASLIGGLGIGSLVCIVLMIIYCLVRPGTGIEPSTNIQA